MNGNKHRGGQMSSWGGVQSLPSSYEKREEQATQMTFQFDTCDWNILSHYKAFISDWCNWTPLDSSHKLLGWGGCCCRGGGALHHYGIDVYFMFWT